MCSSDLLLGIGSLFVGWFIYSFLCDSALGKRPALLGFILFVLLIAAAYGFSKVFSGRGEIGRASCRERV